MTSTDSLGRSIPPEMQASTMPGKATRSGASKTSASQGISTSPSLPTAVIRPSCMTITPFSMGSPPMVMTVPALTA